MDKACGTHESEESFAGILEGKRKFGDPRSGWEGNTEMDIKETEWEIVGRIHLAQVEYV
jgi:hypothetical protein